MTGFIQIIEYTTTRIDEVRKLNEDFRAQRVASGAAMPAVRGTITADRDRPNTFLSIVEFSSYEAAMENSAQPDTTAYAAKMAELCDGPPRFYNLDVLDTIVTMDVQQRSSEESRARADR